LRREDLLSLLEKYREMVRLREVALEPDPPDPRADLKRLAARFPGALREIDQLALDELHDRLRVVERAIEGGEPPRWLEWCASYHSVLRVALEARLARASGEARRERDDDPPELALLMVRVLRPPEGRLNPLVFAWIAERAGVSAAEVERAIFPGHPQKRNPAVE
jgi:hypothetical protein